MILVRRRGLFFEEMVLALKKEGVPVAGADRMVLTKQLVDRGFDRAGPVRLAARGRSDSRRGAQGTALRLR